MVNILSAWKLLMTENTGIVRLWQKFHHLSEHDKDLVLTVAEAIRHSEQDADDLYGEVLQEKEEKRE